MELLQRYLGMVRSGLSGTDRHGIIDELAEHLQSRIDDREAELGRPLSEAEMEALLEAMGHPMVVAGRYNSKGGSLTFGRELIGPELFPFYTLALKYGIGITAAVTLLVRSGLAMAGLSAWFELLPALVSICAVQLAIQTLVWTGIQLHVRRYPESWNPRKQGAVADALTGNKPERERVSRFESVLTLVLIAAIFPSVHSVMWPQHVPFGPGELGPIWRQMYGLAALATLASAAQAVVNLFRPEWTRFRTETQIGVTAVWLVMLCIILQSGNWVVLTDLTGDLLTKRAQVAAINHYVFRYGLLGAIVGATVVLVIQGFALLSELRQRPRRSICRS